MTSETKIATAERLDRASLSALQGERLQRLLDRIYGRSRFYTRRFDIAGVDPSALRFPEDLDKLPLTTKADLIADQRDHPPWGEVISEPLEDYTRYCQTSSTTGSPLRWIDTNESWQWILNCWKVVFRAAGVERTDRMFFPFSFGPFLGFWSAFEAGCQLGVHCVPGGGMSSALRLSVIDAIAATVVCCTPTYALWLADISANERGARALTESPVRLLIVAGEPGGSIPTTRRRIEESWGARVIDHHGLTETGPLSFECLEQPGALHINEGEYIAEVIDPTTTRPVPDGHRGELVVTNLGRAANAAIRYRTGDIVVRRSDPCACGRTWARLEGGILARADDMINIRGVNVYPAAIEAVVRQFPEIVEFRSTASPAGAMWTLGLEVELRTGALDAIGLSDRLAGRLREALGLTIPVRVATPGGLPRFELKARRFIVEGRSENHDGR